MITQIVFLLLSEMFASLMLITSYLMGTMWLFWYMVILLILLGIIGFVVIVDYLINRRLGQNKGR